MATLGAIGVIVVIISLTMNNGIDKFSISFYPPIFKKNFYLQHSIWCSDKGYCVELQMRCKEF